MQFAITHVVTNASMAALVTSPAVPISTMYGYGVQAVYTTSGTLGGVLSLQGSIDHKQDTQGNILVPGDWAPVPNSSELISGAGNFIWDVTLSNVPYVRLVYTPAGGDSGVLNVFSCIKGN